MTPGTRSARHEPRDISQSLLGKLPCVTCGYDLQGLSVLAVCPECGSAVRATILAVVDPLAEELRPIDRPRLVALGLVGWAGTGLLAALTGWVALAIAVMNGWGGGIGQLPWLVDHAGAILAGELWFSALFALLLVHPHRSVGAVNVMLALLAVAAYVPLGWIMMSLAEMAVDVAASGRTDLWMPRPERTLLRMGACVLVLVIIAGLRPNARVLVARSLALRTGRVDRQTLLAVATAAGICIVGDTIGYFAEPMRWGEIAKTIGSVMMILGGGLLTLGLAGALVDAVRIAAAVVAPSPSLRQVVRPAIENIAAEKKRGPTGAAQDMPTGGEGI